MKTPLTGNKDPQNVAYRLDDASKSFKEQSMFKLKVELEACSVCYAHKKHGYTTRLKCQNFHLLTTP